MREKKKQSLPGGGPGEWTWGFGLPLTGLAMGTGAVYLARYAYVQDCTSSSGPAVLAGLGLLGAFCVLTTAAIRGIRLLIIEPGNRFRRLAALVVSLGGLAALSGLVVLGLGV